jgi:predicted phage-related endonuclease
MYPTATEGRKMRLDSEQMSWLRELQARRSVEDAVAGQRAELENRLKAAMGDAEIALAPNDDEVIRWRNFPTVRTDVKGLRAAHPEIAAQYVTTAQTRRFQLL